MSAGRRVLGAALAAVLAAGCGVGAEESARSRTDVPFGLLEPDQNIVLPSPATEPGSAFTTCFVDPAGELVPVRIPTAERVTPAAVVEALGALPGGSAEELTTAVPEETVVESVQVGDGRATVALAPSFSELVPPGDQLRFVAQLVCTLTYLPGVGQVLFTADDQPLDVPAGDGTLKSGPVSRDDYDEMISTGR